MMCEQKNKNKINDLNPTPGCTSLDMQSLRCNKDLGTLITSFASQAPLGACVGRSDSNSCFAQEAEVDSRIELIFILREHLR